MSPIFSYLCSFCAHEFDEIRFYNENETRIQCPHCEMISAEKLPSIPSQARGAFGTYPKKPSKNTTTLNFSKKKVE